MSGHDVTLRVAKPGSSVVCSCGSQVPIPFAIVRDASVDARAFESIVVGVFCVRCGASHALSLATMLDASPRKGATVVEGKPK